MNLGKVRNTNMKKKLFSLVLLFWVCSFINAFDWNGKIKISNWDDINDSHYKWVTTEVFDTFYAKNRDIYLNSFPRLKEKEGIDPAYDKYMKWYELNWTEEICILYRNNQERLCFYPQYFVINDVIQIEQNIIKIHCTLPEYTREIINNSILDYKFITNKNDYIFFFKFDGDYIEVYANDLNTLFYTYAKISKEDENIFFKCMKSNNWENINITYPSHADGSCDYDRSKTTTPQTSKTTSSTNVIKNKTMTVSENLKLRSGEATTSEVLTVMSAGTKVKILELGKAENIDGINSNWVKVEVQSGAKDRDGKTIRTGTVGWCYGGYLAETTEANNFESTDTKEISDIKIEEAPKQEINIGIVCAIIGAVLLLLLLILIFAVRKKKDNP